ncbi:MAG: T9SS type A sorting domain-containing protein [Flavobacteriales bacterium]
MKKPATPSTRTSKWLSYSGMATAFIAVGQKADGQVVYTDVDPDSVLTNSQFDVDFDSDGTNDISVAQQTVVSSSSSTAGAVAIVPPGNAVIGNLNSGYMYPGILLNGDPISPGAPDFQTAALGTLAIVYNGSNTFGAWSGQTGFMGCRFVAGDGFAHYGWVELAVAAGATSVTVIAYGYESLADSAIVAGDQGPLGIGTPSASFINFGVAPNPVQTQTTVVFTAAEAAEVQMSIVNAMGQVLLNERRNAAAGPNTFTLDMSAQAEGTYFVRMQSGKQVAFRKVTKVG